MTPSPFTGEVTLQKRRIIPFKEYGERIYGYRNRYRNGIDTNGVL